MGKKAILKKLDSDLESGLIGLKISLFSLIVIVFLMIIFISFKATFSEMTSYFLKMPKGDDYLAIFGLSILFIVIPFAMAIKLKKRI